MDLKIDRSLRDGSWHVALSGEIDIFNSSDLKTQLARLMEETVADVHVDCENLQYIDSTGLGALVGALKNIKSHDKEMHLSNVKPNLLKLFHITNLDKVFILKENYHE